MSTLEKIVRIAKEFLIDEKYLELYGDYKAKIKPSFIKDIPPRDDAKYIVVTSITPSALGEGKTLTTIALSMALNRAGRRAICTLRQSSLGPVFGVKGAAAGGGKAQLIPSDDVNLHLTGDAHAVGVAHNLLSAFIDNHIYRKNKLGIEKILWRRVIDVNDRSLRNIAILTRKGKIRYYTGFDIIGASEIMAILALCTSYKDLRERISRIIAAITVQREPVTALDLRCAGAMASLLKDAMKPNLVQTCENTPCLIHTGPFGNISHGSSSIIADYVALRIADYVVTESGFGADLGLEKFIDIKCMVSGLIPHACVIVVSTRALKLHSGRFSTSQIKQIHAGVEKEDIDAIVEGSNNLKKIIDIVHLFGLPCLVCINKFPEDKEGELSTVLELSKKYGAKDAVILDAYVRGSEGAIDAANALIRICQRYRSSPRPLYEKDLSLNEKIKIIATKVYGASDINLAEDVQEKIDLYNKWGLSDLAVCIAKTQFSLSHDPALKGAPEGFVLPVNDIRISAGAGYVYPICGKIMTMPGLPRIPLGERFDINERGEIIYF